MRDELAIEEVIQNRMPWSRTSDAEGPDPVLLLTREWLVTNGLGGYASATVSGACTRRYHGLLIAALPAPLGRGGMFNHLSEELKPESGEAFRLDADDPLNAGTPAAGGGSTSVPIQFELENGLPV